MEYQEEDYLMLSGIQHFAFCRRQWALIHIEQLWEENLRTTEGELLHNHAHDSYSSDSRKEILISRGVPVFSRKLGVSGECDIIEFQKSKVGITLAGKEGFYHVYPVEYKRGEPKDNDIDILQLVAQVMCLEEMLVCNITDGAIYYAKTRHRQKVIITEEMRKQVIMLFDEMHSYIKRGYLPSVRPSKSCNACSLKELCMPKLYRIGSAKKYLQENLLRDPEDSNEKTP